jgi:hypothetical protein
MGKFSKEFSVGNMHPRENFQASAALGSLGATLECDADGASTLSIVVLGTYVGTLTFEESSDNFATVDSIAVKPNRAGGLLVLTLASGAVGRWKGGIGSAKKVRARMSNWTSGAPTVLLMANNGIAADLLVIPKADQQHAEIIGAAGALTTLTLPAPGLGLFQYISRFHILRIVSAGPLVAAAAPLSVTTTNLIGSRTEQLPADAAAVGLIAERLFESSKPIRASSANTAVTFVMPATTGVIWFASAEYDNLPEG